jgi:regulator of protease activity HflC (stomatin/prohibitin superfamily)
MSQEIFTKDAEKKIKRRAYKWSIPIVVLYFTAKIALSFNVGKENADLIIVSSIVVVLIFLLLFKFVKIAKDNERFVLFRLGNYIGIKGAGIVPLIPFIDKVVRVNLDLNIPDWKLLSDTELEEKLKYIVIYTHDNIIKM